jgi:hypothetical protein
LPLGGAFTRYLSVEILALHPRNVKHSVGNIFPLPRARLISRRGIPFRDKNIIAKIIARAAEFSAIKFQFSRRRIISCAAIAWRSARKVRLQGVPKKSTIFRLPDTQ